MLEPMPDALSKDESLARQSRVFKIIWLSVTSLALISLLIILASRYRLHTQIAEQHLNNLADIYVENTRLVMGNVESIMRSIGTEFQNQADAETLDDFLEDIATRLPHLEGLFVLNEAGIIVADSLVDDTAVGNNRRDGVLFRVHLDNDQNTLFVRDPLQTDRTDKWVMPISYGMHDDDGELITVVVASIESAYFSGSLKQLTLANQQGITGYIINPRDIVLTSIPFQPAYIGQLLASHPTYQRLIEMPASSIYHGTGFNSTTTHLSTYRHIQPYAYGIIFSQDRSYVLQPLIVEGIIAGICFLLLSLVLYFILRQQQQHAIEQRKAELMRMDAARMKFEAQQQQQLIDLKHQFITIASHNFRTPLAVIQSSTGLLERYADRYSPEQQRDKLRRIRKQVNHMNRLLNDVLSLKKGQGDKVKLVPTTFNLHQLCHDLWSDIRDLEASEHHRTEFDYQATIEDVTGDKVLIQEILLNLLSNALKYTPAGNLVAFSVSNDDQWVIFTIRDEGYGIPVDEQDKLFQSFFRAGNVQHIEGTGLGLAIVKQYVDLHGGTIDIRSSEETGTSVTVRLPHDVTQLTD